MLNELRIRNFAIIDQLHLTFGPGLNILTGETGAGKSIIIDAVGLLLGERASDRGGARRQRGGRDRGRRSGCPTTPTWPSRCATCSKNRGLDDPDNPDWVVLSREVRLNGRNICRINGRSVSLQTLSELADLLVDVHGQGEHLNLLKPKTHVAAARPLCRAAAAAPRGGAAGGQPAPGAQRAAAAAPGCPHLGPARRPALVSGRRNRRRQPAPGEEQELESERRRLGNAETLMNLAQAAQAILSQEDGEMPGAVDMVGEAVGKLEKLARVDPDMSQTADEAQVLLEQLGDLARTLQDYAESLEFNPERLTEVEERLELIASLKRKYGDTIEQINAYGARAQTGAGRAGQLGGQDRRPRTA